MQKRHAFLASSIGSALLIISLSVFVIPWNFSYSVEDIPQIFRNALISSAGATITVTGESSKRIEPDQVTIDVSVQTSPTDINSIVSNQQDSIKKVVDTITSAVQPNSTSIKVNQISINPLYSNGNAIDSALFAAYSSYPVKTDFDHFSDIASKLTNAGFRMDSLSVTQVPVNASKANSTNIAILQGSSNSNNQLFYSPSDSTVNSGTIITWTNQDSAAHTVTSGMPSDTQTGALFDSGLLKPASTFSFTIYNTGAYNYYCQVHPWMTGTITVTGNNKTQGPIETKSQITMNVIIDTKPDTIQNAVHGYQTRLATLEKILNENGISTSDTKQNQVNFNQAYSNPAQYTSFSANTDIIVKTDPKNLDKITNAAKDAKANISSITLSISDSAIDSARKDLTQKALEDATKNAQDIIEQSGLQIKGIKNIDVNPALANQGANAIPYRGVIFPTNNLSYYTTSDTKITVQVEFEVGK